MDAINELKLSCSFAGAELVHHFSELKMLFVSRPAKYVLVEFKTSVTLFPSKVTDAANTYVKLLEEHLRQKLYIRQIAYNMKNIVEVYLQPTTTPRALRKAPPSSGFSDCSSTDTTSPSRTSRPPSLEVEVSTLQGFNITSFDRKPVLAPILHRSQAIQTAQPSSSEPVVMESKPLTKTFIPSHSTINKQRVTGQHFHLARKYLAYFKTPHTFHNGDSHVTCTLQLLTEGLPVSEELKTLYYEAMRERGFTDNQISYDLKCLTQHYNVLRVNHLANSQKSVADYYHGRVQAVSPAPTSPALAGCDPECCTLM